MDLFGIGAGISGAAMAAASYAGQRYQADKQLQATQETNAQNYKIWQEEMAHNIEMYKMQNSDNVAMWEMQNAYNDPSAVMQRYRDAGLNPYMMMANGGTAGSATSAPQIGKMNPSSAPTMQAPPSEAFRSPLSQALVDGLSTLQGVLTANSQRIDDAGKVKDNNMKDLEEEQLRLRNELDKLQKKWKEETFEDEKKRLKQEIDRNTLAYDQASEELDLFRRTKQTKIDYEKRLLDIADAELYSKQLDNKIQESVARYADEKQQVELATMYATLNNLHLQGVLTEKEIKNRIADTLLKYHQANTEVAKQDNLRANTTLVGEQIVNEQTKGDILEVDRSNAYATADAYVDAMNAQYKRDQAVNTLEGIKAQNVIDDRNNPGLGLNKWLWKFSDGFREFRENTGISFGIGLQKKF